MILPFGWMGRMPLKDVMQAMLIQVRTATAIRSWGRSERGTAQSLRLRINKQDIINRVDVNIMRVCDGDYSQCMTVRTSVEG
jgi:hypothetical protein